MGRLAQTLGVTGAVAAVLPCGTMRNEAQAPTHTRTDLRTPN